MHRLSNCLVKNRTSYIRKSYMKRVFLISLIACLLMACEGTGIYQPKTLKLSPAQKQMVSVSNDFSFGLLRQVASQEQDFFISPLSASFALAMLANGADGDTQSQIVDMLGFDSTALDEMNDYHHELLSTLPDMEKNTKIDIANAIFVQQGFPISELYKKSMKDIYLAEVQNVDFQSAAAIDHINTWAKNHTNKRIDKVLSPDDINEDTRVILANALSFLGKWNQKFEATNTRKEDFHNADGSTTTVDMMNIKDKFYAGKIGNYYVLEMPYTNSTFEMDILLPADGATLQDVIDSLDANTWLTNRPAETEQDWQNMLQQRQVVVKMPKFTYEYSRSLTDDLVALGMKDAFNRLAADFSVMSPEEALYVSFVNQKTYLKIDEAGTEAHAVTTIGMDKATSVDMGEEMLFYVDEPFLFFIRERANGIILFAGCKSKM